MGPRQELRYQCSSDSSYVISESCPSCPSCNPVYSLKRTAGALRPAEAPARTIAAGRGQTVTRTGPQEATTNATRIAGNYRLCIPVPDRHRTDPEQQHALGETGRRVRQ